MKCLNCSTETTNPKFCSRSCSTSYNNARIPKRKRQRRYCIHCNAEVPDRRRYCETCNVKYNKNYVDWSKITYGELKKKRKYQKNSQIRDLARKKFVNSDSKCAICGYDKHVEVHHIKQISSFSDEDVVTEINDIENIILLCPNCHWEYHNK